MNLVEEMVGVVVWRIIVEPELHFTNEFVFKNEVDCDILEFVKLLLDRNNDYTRSFLEVLVCKVELVNLSNSDGTPHDIFDLQES